MDEFLKIAIPAIVGLLSGAVGSLIAPWVSWGIEKKRALLVARRDFLKECRELVHQAASREAFRESHVYARVRPLLSPKTVESIETETIIVQIEGRGGGVNNYAPAVLDDITRIEREWGLL